MPPLRRASLALLVCALVPVPLSAQVFVKAPGQIPAGAPFNASRTENVDFGDVDLDGDFDVAMADGGDCCNDQNRLWVNQGGAQGGTIGFFEDETAAQCPNVADQSRDVEFADFDGDGDLDLCTANTSQTVSQTNRFWCNQGGLQAGTVGFYADETQARWVGLALPASSIAASQLLPGGGYIDYSCDSDFADLDDDGDLDLVQSSYGGAFGGQVPTRLFLNDGAGFFGEHNPSGFKLTGQTLPTGSPALWAEGTQLANTLESGGANADIATTALDIELGDVDGDWDVDILHGARQEPPRMFQSRLSETGVVIWRDVTGSAFAPGYSSGNGHYEQEFGDFDDDDDLDILGVNWFNNFEDDTLRNSGGFFAEVTKLPGSVADDNEGDFGDYDNDGDLDLYIASWSGQDKLYRNELAQTGAPSFVPAQAELPTLTQVSLDADWGDIDGDGDSDVLVATNNNAPNELLLNTSEVPDTHAPRAVRLEQAPDRSSSAVPTFVRAHLYDNAPYYATWYADVVLDFRVDGGPWYTLPMPCVGGQLFRGEISGALIGTIEYRVRAADLSGNVGLSQVQSFTALDGGCNGSITTYCTAKPTSLPGCSPSFYLNGVPSASAKTAFTVNVNSVPGGNPGLFLYTTNGAAATPIQTAFGFLCIQSGPGMFRIGFQFDEGTQGACVGSYGMNFNQYIHGQTQDPALGAGASVDVQCWYRDPPNPGSANLTQALHFTVCP
jgi:hypothetical protein